MPERAGSGGLRLKERECDTIDVRQLPELDEVEPPFSGFTFGDERLRLLNRFSRLGLSEASI